MKMFRRDSFKLYKEDSAAITRRKFEINFYTAYKSNRTRSTIARGRDLRLNNDFPTWTVSREL